MLFAQLFFPILIAGLLGLVSCTVRRFNYGLKLVPIDSSDVGQEAPSDCKILVMEILLEFRNGGLGEAPVSVLVLYLV